MTIQRDHEDCGIFGERYVLHVSHQHPDAAAAVCADTHSSQLFESYAQPHLYWFAARHYKSRTHTQPRDYRPSDTCQLLATELGHFCAFFAKKTGVSWDERMVTETPARKLKQTENQDVFANLDILSEMANFFRYVKPVGINPYPILDSLPRRSLLLLPSS